MGGVVFYNFTILPSVTICDTATEEEYFDLSRYGIDKFVVIRHVYDRVQKNGKAVSHEDLRKKLVD